LITEADTCRKYVLPKLYAAGWTDDQINEQKTFTDGRIVVVGDKVSRRASMRRSVACRRPGWVEGTYSGIAGPLSSRPPEQPWHLSSRQGISRRMLAPVSLVEAPS
jgi:hypothetical protein